jgi:hypothetical protein
MAALAQLLLQTAAFQQLLETAQRAANWLSFVNTHP